MYITHLNEPGTDFKMGQSESARWITVAIMTKSRFQFDSNDVFESSVLPPFLRISESNLRGLPGATWSDLSRRMKTKGFITYNILGSTLSSFSFSFCQCVPYLFIFLKKTFYRHYMPYSLVIYSLMVPQLFCRIWMDILFLESYLTLSYIAGRLF